MNKEDMKHLLSERTKHFKIVEGIVLLAVVMLLFGGIVYYSEADRFQFNHILKEVQRQVAQSGQAGKIRLGAPEGIVPIFQDMMPDQEAVKIGLMHPAGDARREGCEFFLTEREVQQQELVDTGYQLVSKKGEYHLYSSLLDEGVLHSGHDVVVQQLHDLLLTNLIVLITTICGDCETWRNRHTNVVHLSKVSTLTAKFLTHLCVSFGLTITEEVNSFLTHTLITYYVDNILLFD